MENSAYEVLVEEAMRRKVQGFGVWGLVLGSRAWGSAWSPAKP